MSDGGGGDKSSHTEAHDLSPRWRIALLVSCCVVGLWAGSGNALNSITAQLESDVGLSESQSTLLTSLGLLGVQFTLPAGWALDKFGRFRVGLAGAVMMVGGYIALSVTPASLFPVMILSLAVMSFGSGGVFNTALQTSMQALPSNVGLAVSLTGFCFSISQALCVQMNGIYQNAADCHADSCWRAQIRLLAIVMAIFVTPAVAVFGYTLLPAANATAKIAASRSVNGTPDLVPAGTGAGDVPPLQHSLLGIASGGTAAPAGGAGGAPITVVISSSAAGDAFDSIEDDERADEAAAAALLTRDSDDSALPIRTNGAAANESPLSSAESTVVSNAAGGLPVVGSAPAGTLTLPLRAHHNANALTSANGTPVLAPNSNGASNPVAVITGLPPPLALGDSSASLSSSLSSNQNMAAAYSTQPFSASSRALSNGSGGGVAGGGGAGGVSYSLGAAPIRSGKSKAKGKPTRGVGLHAARGQHVSRAPTGLAGPISVSGTPPPGVLRRQGSASPKHVEQHVSMIESFEVFREPYFGVVFFAFFSGVAAGLFILASTRELWQNYYGNDSDTAPHADWYKTAATLFSVGNALSALVSGFATDWFQTHHRISRMSVLGGVYAFTAFCFTGLGLLSVLHRDLNVEPSDSDQSVFIALLSLIGVGFGTNFGITPGTVGEVFGLKNFGKIFAFMQLGGAVATLGVPNITPVVRAHTGTYTALYFAFAALMLICALVCICTTPPHLMDPIELPPSAAAGTVATGAVPEFPAAEIDAAAKSAAGKRAAAEASVHTPLL